MKKLLHGLGIKNLFTRTADLSHLTDEGYVAVSQVSLLKLFALWIITVCKGPSQEAIPYTLIRTLIGKGPPLPHIWNLHTLISLDPTWSMRCVEVRGGYISYVLNTFQSCLITGGKLCLKKNIVGGRSAINKNYDRENHCKWQSNGKSQSKEGNLERESLMHSPGTGILLKK